MIELLIVVVIIGILAAIAVPKFSSTREKAFKSAIMSDLKNLATQEEIYHNQYFAFAGTLADAQATESEAVTINESSGTGWSAIASHAGVPSQQCGIYHGDAVAADRRLVRHRESARVDRWAGPGELQPTLRPT
jgi:Tfp pilus assembly protein PilE